MSNGLHNGGALAPRVSKRVRVRVSRAARRGVSTSVSRRLLRAEDRGILNNRRIEYPQQPEDRSVPRFEYRYPQQQIHVIGSIAGRQQVSMREQQVSMREQSIAVKASGSRPKGKRPDNNRQAATERKRRNKRASGPDINKDKRSKLARGHKSTRGRAWSRGIEMEKDRRSNDSGNSTCRL